MNLKLINKITETNNIKSFFFKPDTKFTHVPGQYVYITLPKLNYPDPRGETRDFTISSSPTEKSLIKITTKIRQESGYKKTLDELKIGDSVEAKGPFGTFILDIDSNKTNNIFLAGGIGITPFRSFIKFNVDKKLNISMHLIYSNTNEDEITFKDELVKLEKENNFLKIDFYISGKEGHLDEIKLKNLILDSLLTKSKYWIVGPPTFVTAMESVLEKLGVSSDKIRVEKFTGY